MKLSIPELSMICLVGVSGSGKSTFARQHFSPTEILSSDQCRSIVSNDENSLEATDDAFALLHFILEKRLRRGLLSVVDATNVQPKSRKSLIEVARKYHTLPVAIVLDLPRKVCEERNIHRTDRNLKPHVIRQQYHQLKKSIRSLKKEGFRKIYVLKSVEEVHAVEGCVREKLYSNKKELKGPFDIIGDIHGCYEELVELMGQLGYLVHEEEAELYGVKVDVPMGRTLVFLGDLVDRGPDALRVLKLVMHMVNEGTALCVPGNHDVKLQKWLRGKDVAIKHGLGQTIDQLSAITPAFKEELAEFLYQLTSHYVLDEGKLVVAHAGIREEMQGRGSGAVRSFCLYGETTGEIDEFGLPVRYNWASDYRGQAKVIYGHTPIPEPEWLNNTLNIDTGCVFGGKLTALRYPEEELVSVPAKEIYWEAAKPIQPAEHVSLALSQQQQYDDLLFIEDVVGKRIIQTRLRNNLTIHEENSIAALEVMSRFAIHPKWLLYLPPTMSPCPTSEKEGYLEHPKEAIDFYAKRGVKTVVCEEKHMGSRAIVVIGKDEQVIQERFGLENQGIGKCYTRTGRNFFLDPEVEGQFLALVCEELTAGGAWENLETDWICLDCELMPWSAKAQALIQSQYAAVGSAASHALPQVLETLKQAKDRGIKGAGELWQKYGYRQKVIGQYIQSYRHYCWPVQSVSDLTLAPFHILATEGKVHIDRTHQWHMDQIKQWVGEENSLLHATAYRVVEVEDRDAVEGAINWWEALTESGGEGMVIKPLDFVAYGKGGLMQPAVKCRGKEYLRIIYGPEYDHPDHLKQLKKRGLSKKASLALREFALGIEALERFVRKEPLRRVHESVFAVLALESEQVDPRL